MSRMSEDLLLVALLLALGPLLLLQPEQAGVLHRLVDWKTIGALAGLLVLSRGLEDSGYLTLAGRRLLAHIHGERTLASLLVLFAGGLSTVLTNDVALFIVVPLTLGLRLVADLPIGRLIVFEALAVNAGSSLSPIGNPQNLYLWQSSHLGFVDFALMMLPLAAALMLLVLAAIPLGFPSRRITITPGTPPPSLNRALLIISLALYLPFLVLADIGHAAPAAIAVIVLYRFRFPDVLSGVDWFLLAVFVLMFVDLGLLATLPEIRALAGHIDALPGGMFTAAVVLSQLISNVPATIFLASFGDEIRALAWGVSVGGFGIAIGSLANLIALRLSRQPGLWREFHAWSVPMLLVATTVASGLIRVLD